MHYSLFSPVGADPFSVIAPFLLIAIVWETILKGFALWYAARGGQKWWFVAILLVNTVGILEIIYLIWFRPKTFALEEEPEKELTTQA